MKIRTLLGLLVVVAVAIVAVMYAPTNLGGSTTYVSTHGTSMSPRFHAGDLAVVQPAGSYRVGDIAAYRSTTLHGATVLHRIIAINDGHFTFKGDKNNFIDPDHPTVGQIVGRLRYRIPRGGIIRAWVARPIVVFPLLVLALSVSLGRKRRRRSASHNRLPALALLPENTAPRGQRRRLGVVVPIAAALTAAGFLVAAVAVWNIPRSETATHRDSYLQTLALAYSGTTAKGAAYPDGKIATGDPVFTRLVDRVGIDLDYGFRSAASARHVAGTYQMIMNIKSATGLSRSVPLTPTRPFAGNHVRGHATLDLNQVRALETRFSNETGLATSQATVTVEAGVRIAGKLATTPFSGAVTTKMDFQLTAIEMIPSSASARSAGTVKSAGSVVSASVRAGELSLWKLHLAAETARLALLVAFALALAAAATVLAVDRKRIALGELDAILRRYGRILIPVSSVPRPGDRGVVQVESMRALARLAELHEQPIVHAAAARSHRFALSTDTSVYCYDAPGIGTPSLLPA
jgi:signal peptidase I